MGAAIESLGGRKGELLAMEPQGGGRQRLRFAIPTRTLIGFRSDYLTMTRGEGIMTHAFKGFQPYRGARRLRNRGAIIAMNKGETSAYALWQLEDRGSFIVPPGIQVYEGMVVGLCNKDRDLVVNTSRKKQLTNVRASGHDDAIRLTPHLQLSLEAALELIEADELVEVTPKSIRVRKKILNLSQRESWEKRPGSAYPAAGCCIWEFSLKPCAGKTTSSPSRVPR